MINEYFNVISLIQTKKSKKKEWISPLLKSLTFRLSIFLYVFFALYFSIIQFAKSCLFLESLYAYNNYIYS